MVFSSSGNFGEEDDGFGCHEASLAALEHDGVHHSRSERHQRPLLHVHSEHHSGWSWSHSDPQELAADSRAEIGSIHSVGPCINSGGSVAYIAVRHHVASRVYPHVGKSHQHLDGMNLLIFELVLYSQMNWFCSCLHVRWCSSTSWGNAKLSWTSSVRRQCSRTRWTTHAMLSRLWWTSTRPLPSRITSGLVLEFTSFIMHFNSYLLNL